MFSIFRKKNKKIESLKQELTKALDPEKRLTVSQAFRHIMSSVDVPDMIRSYEINTIKRGDPTVLIEYLKQVHELRKNKNLERLVTDLMIEQTSVVALEAQTWDGVLAGRGTVNGIKLVWDTILRLSVEYQNSIDKPRLDTTENNNYN